MITVELKTWKTALLLSVRAPHSAGLERNLQRLLRDEVSRLDVLASRFRSDSELSRVNAHAGQWTEVSWGFVGVLSACLDAAALTGGLVDPTLGTAIKAAGYDEWAGQPTTTTAEARTGNWRCVGIRPGTHEASVLIPEGSALDLGSIAKAWLADRLATAVARSGYEVCANMGGDIRVIADTGWTLWADPELPEHHSIPIDVTDAGLATSGIGHRTWRDGHHIIDPRTGRSAATPWHSVAVVAGTAIHANAAATAGVILGHDGPEWMRRKGLDARFTNDTTELTTNRWPQEVAA